MQNFRIYFLIYKGGELGSSLKYNKLYFYQLPDAKIELEETRGLRSY